MKKIITFLIVILLFTSCGSGKSFQSFFNDHKRDLGVTAFQVPNFLKGVLKNISPETGGFFKNVSDFKFITFSNITKEKQQQLINEINLVANNSFTDMIRSNQSDKTKIVTVKEDGDVVTQAIIFNSTLKKTSAFYLKGRFDPNKLKQLSENNQFDKLSNQLIKNQQNLILNPSFNPNNK